MDTLSLPEHVVLALLCEGPSHGFALSRLLLARGEIGRVYTVARPAAYRALNRLEAAGLVERIATESGAGGPERTVFAATTAGSDESSRWLSVPVGHVREMRTEFLAKLVLLDRVGANRRALVAAQRAVLEPIVASRVGAATAGVPAGGPIDREAVIDLWRYSSAEAALRFVDELARLDG